MLDVWFQPVSHGYVSAKEWIDQWSLLFLLFGVSSSEVNDIILFLILFLLYLLKSCSVKLNKWLTYLFLSLDFALLFIFAFFVINSSCSVRSDISIMSWFWRINSYSLLIFSFMFFSFILFLIFEVNLFSGKNFKWGVIIFYVNFLKTDFYFQKLINFKYKKMSS